MQFGQWDNLLKEHTTYNIYPKQINTQKKECSSCELSFIGGEYYFAADFVDFKQIISLGCETTLLYKNGLSVDFALLRVVFYVV